MKHLSLLILLSFSLTACNAFSQKIKIKKDKVLVNRTEILAIESLIRSGNTTTFSALNNDNKRLKIVFEYSNELLPEYTDFKVIISNPATEISFKSQDIKSTKEAKAAKEVLNFLLEENLMFATGDFNTDIAFLEKIAAKNIATFWTETAEVTYKVDKHQYKLSDIYFSKTKKEFYRIAKINKAKEVVKSVDIEKSYTENGETLRSEIELKDNVFVITKVKTLPDASKMYGTDKVIIDSNGIPYADKNNGQFEKIKAIEEIEFETVTTLATFPGSKNAVYNWVRKKIDAYDFIDYIDENTRKLRLRVEFVIDENGKVGNIKVKGTDVQKIKDIVIRKFETMPNWSPAENNGVKVKSSFTLPLTLAFQ